MKLRLYLLIAVIPLFTCTGSFGNTIVTIPADGNIFINPETFNSHDNSTSIAYQSTFNFNPIDKIVELFEEKEKLYEQLLASEREKVEILKNSK